VRAYNVYSYFLRTNKSIKTVLIVITYYAFYLKAVATKRIPLKKVKFEDYYIFGFNP
jgi:hypothetical protein